MSKENEIVNREVRYSLHLPKNSSRPDLHFIKEQITYKDGTRKPNVRFVKDFERPIFVTSKSKRDHLEKKEFEDMENLMMRKTTQSDLNMTTAQLLGEPHLVNNRNAIKDSPYVYGYDISSTALTKLQTLSKNDMVQTPYTVAGFDIETTTDEENKETLISTVVYKIDGKLHIRTGIITKFLKGFNDPGALIKLAFDKYLPQYKDAILELTYHDNVVDLHKEIFKTANDWAPDFLAIWNMDFDISVILAELERNRVNPIDVICNTNIPRQYRYCKYKQGPKKKVTASGVVKPINPALQWHTLFSTSNFYVIDGMCTYKQLRMARAEEPSYALDAILKKELNTQKLKFTEADGYQRKAWHDFMQANYPIEYVIYNMYDCISMLELDEKIGDLRRSIGNFAGITDFWDFSKQSRKLTDSFFLFGLKRNRVIGTVAGYKEEEETLDDDDDEEFDPDDPNNYSTLGLKGWIQLLPQDLLISDGLTIFEDFPNIKTNARGIVCDFDSVSSYPSCTEAGNVSKETCVNEIITIEGLTQEVFKQQNLGVCLGNVNMLEYFEVMFNIPDLDEVSRLADELIAQGY